MPVIVNAILNEHQIIVDIVAFVGKGDFPRSRLGEKQRGKILAGWVSRKMRTIAQFSIKGGNLGIPGSSDSMPAGVPDQPLAYEGGGLNRGSLGSFRSTGVAGATSSLRNVEHAPQILEQRELEQQLEGMAALGGGTGFGYQDHPQPLDTPLAEMPADEVVRGDEDRDGETPTKARHERERVSSYHVPAFAGYGAEEREGKRESTGGQTPVMRLPGVDGRESFDGWSGAHGQQGQGHVDGRNSLPSRQRYSGVEQGGEVEEDEWERDAGMYMNLAGTLGKREG